MVSIGVRTVPNGPRRPTDARELRRPPSRPRLHADVRASGDPQSDAELALWVRIAALLAALLIAVLALPAAASAHAELRGVERVQGGLRLSFDAPVESAFLRVAAANGVASEVGGTAPEPVAAVVDPVDPQAILVPVPGAAIEGTRVSWRVLSQDGHATSGDVRFPLGGVDAAVAGMRAGGAGPGDWVAGVGRLLVLVGAVLGLGLVAFRWVVAAPAWASGGLAPPGAPSAEAFRERAGAALSAAAGGWHLAWRVAAAVCAVGVPLIAVGTLMAVEGGAGDLGTLLSETRVGTGIVVIAVAAATGAALGVVTRRRLEGAAPSGSWAVVLGAPSVAALAAMSWMGHASSGNDVTLNVGADLLHNGATAAWIGGLLGLLAYLLPAGVALAEGDRMRLVAQGVVRFSTLATVCVAVLVITGVYRALAEVGALSDLVETGYGVALLVKLGLFAVMLGGGGYNRFVLHPRLERAALGLPGGESAAAERLARSVRAELALAGLLLVAVAVLVSSAPTV